MVKIGQNYQAPYIGNKTHV